jgi:Ca2+/Na+ antiporter
MDAKAKDQFRWKFYRLAVELNIIILLVAVSVLILFILPERLVGYRFPLIAVMLLAAVILSVDFRKHYHETKAWLHQQPDKREAERKEE